MKESIESILGQTYSCFEFVIVDDGSEDNSRDIIAAYQISDPRIRLLTAERRGLVFVLNQGIAASNGQYIARMDCDDVSLPQRLQRQVNYLDKYENIAILGTWIKAFGDVDKERLSEIDNTFNISFRNKDVQAIFLGGNAIAHPSVMMKKDVIGRLNGYRCRYSTAEDYDMWVRALNNGHGISSLEEQLLRYRVHDTSKSTEDSKRISHLEDIINIKFDLLEGKLDNRINKYTIWGAGTRGDLVKGIVASRMPYAQLVAYVDMYRTGEKDNISIYNPKELSRLKFDYMFVATTPGKAFAEKYLDGIGLKRYVNFVSL